MNALDRRQASTNNVPMNSTAMTELPPYMRPERSFQGLILALQRYSAELGLRHFATL